MISLLFLAVLSTLLSLLLTPAVRQFARRRELLDRPDGLRKTHADAVPRLGGIVIGLAYVAAFALWQLTPLNAGIILEENLPAVLRYLPAAVAILGLGTLDDLRPLRPWQKLAGQVAVAVLVFALGLRVTNLAGNEIHGIGSFLVTVFWLLLCTNAFNLIDGMDGLASGVALFGTLTILVMSLLQGNVPLALATAPLAGALLGFLRYNMPPASIFLGDSGSLLVGFLLGSFAIVWSQKCATLLGLTAPVMAFAIPILDTALAVARRFLRREPIFSADRGHIHHKLLDLGLSRGRALLLLYAAGAVAAAFSLLQTVFANQAAGVVTVLFCAIVWFGVQSLGYVEFQTMGRLLRRGTLRQFVSAEIQSEALSQELSHCETVREAWLALERLSRRNGFLAAEATIHGHSYGAAPQVEYGWMVGIPLRRHGFLRLYRSASPALAEQIASGSFDQIRAVFCLRLDQITGPGPAPHTYSPAKPATAP